MAFAFHSESKVRSKRYRSCARARRAQGFDRLWRPPTSRAAISRDGAARRTYLSRSTPLGLFTQSLKDASADDVRTAHEDFQQVGSREVPRRLARVALGV